MRTIGWMAGAVLILAACGGGEQGAQPAPAPAAPAPAPAPAGAVHDVQMVLEGTAYKFVPAELTIKPGDKVVYHNTSGGPHNVAFWADSIPSGAEATLASLMTGDKLEALSGPLLIEPDVTYSITFTGLPVGEYKLHCTPHLAMGMVGKVTIAQ